MQMWQNQGEELWRGGTLLCNNPIKLQLFTLTPPACCWRLVQRVPAGVGPFPQAGRPQHADALPGVVALWDCRVPGWHHQRGGAGRSVRHVSAGHHGIFGNSLSPENPDRGVYSLLSHFLLTLQIPLGFSVAASVRVGNALGAGNTERAKLSSKVSLIFTRMDHTVTPPSASCNAPFGGQTLSFWGKS